MTDEYSYEDYKALKTDCGLYERNRDQMGFDARITSGKLRISGIDPKYQKALRTLILKIGQETERFMSVILGAEAYAKKNIVGILNVLLPKGGTFKEMELQMAVLMNIYGLAEQMMEIHFAENGRLQCLGFERKPDGKWISCDDPEGTFPGSWAAELEEDLIVPLLERQISFGRKEEANQKKAS